LGVELGVAVEVTHSGDGPEALDATQPGGRAGATTPSKFSLENFPVDTCVGSDAVLLPVLASLPPDTVAVLVTVPAVTAFTFNVIGG